MFPIKSGALLGLSPESNDVAWKTHRLRTGPACGTNPCVIYSDERSSGPRTDGVAGWADIRHPVQRQPRISRDPENATCNARAREAKIAHLHADGSLNPLSPTGVRYVAAHLAELGGAWVRWL